MGAIPWRFKSSRPHHLFMTVPTHIFREYDIRGIADDEFKSELITDLGLAFASLMLAEQKRMVAVGYDMRPSSDRLKQALIKGLVEGGMEVLDLGMVPTPVLYFAVSHLKIDAGICITGSHNPIEYNGFKIHLSDRSFFGAEIQKLRALIEAGNLPLSEGGSVKEQAIIPDYIKHVLGIFGKQRSLKVVVDSGHGMGGAVAPELIRGLGHDVIELYSNLDPNFPDHHPDPADPKNLKDVQAKVLETGADLGVAYDGDADRIGVVDEKGEVIAGDKLLLLCTREILKRRPDATIIGDVKCSQAVYAEIKELGGNPIMWKTGHSLIKAKMKETGAALAGELSGHMFFEDRWFGFDDALYATCRVLELVSLQDKKLSEHLADFPALVSTPELHIDCADDKKFDLVKAAVENFKREHEVIDIDGARVLFDDGWGLVRASNTQPVLVLRFEAQNQAALERIQKYIQDTVKTLSETI